MLLQQQALLWSSDHPDSGYGAQATAGKRQCYAVAGTLDHEQQREKKEGASLAFKE